MPGMLGSSGYTPEGTEHLESALQKGMYGEAMGKPDYEAFKREFGKQSLPAGRGTMSRLDDFEQRARDAWNEMSVGEKSKYAEMKPAPEFENLMSGYDVSKTFKEGTPYGYTPERAMAVADPLYAGIESQAIEGAKSGFQSAMDAASGAMGRRGIQYGGLGSMAMGDVGGALSRDIAGIRRDVGFQRAQDLSKLSQFDIQNMLQNRQFGAQFGEGQRQFSSGQQARNMAQQQAMDMAQWGQQYQMHRDPKQDMMNLYGMQMGAPGNQPQSGWGAPLFKGLGDAISGKSVGNIMGSMGGAGALL